MQTFLPYSDFEQSARVLDRQRLGKQRIEALQILNAILAGPITRCTQCDDGWTNDHKFNQIPCRRCKGVRSYSTPWYNYPATQMWLGYEVLLAMYGIVICDEWTARGYRDSVKDKILQKCTPIYVAEGPFWLGDKSFHASHRAALLFKNPEWYGQFGWTEEPKIDYIWLVKKDD